MIKILNVSSHFSKQMQIVSNVLNDRIIFVEPSDKNDEFGYRSISIVNMNSNDVIKHNLPDKTKIINSSNSEAMFYYAQVCSHRNNSSVNVNIRKLNLETLHDQEVHTIEAETLEQDAPTVYVALNSKIVGIDERYCLFFVPHKKLYYFSECLLVDSLENKSFPVKGEFTNGDSLLRLQDICVINDSQHILIKTGRIQEFEKKEFWDQSVIKGKIPDYSDQNESLILLNTQQFISDVRNNEKLSEIIVDSADFQSALSLCGWCGHKLTYTKKMFNENKNRIFTYRLDTSEYESKEIIESYERIICAPEKYYLISCEGKDDNTNIHILDSTANTIFQISGPRGIAAIDEEKIITYRYDFDEGFNQIIDVNSIHSGELIGTFQARMFEYDLERNLLIIF